MKIKLLLFVFGIICLTTSCKSSGWSCQKRYVNNKPYDFKKHHVLTNFDKMMLEKYNINKKPLN
jgi:hypothetical protein